MVKIIPSERKVIGYCRNNHGGVPSNFHNYFVAVFDHDFASAHTWQGDTLNFNSLEEQGNHSGAILGFKTKKGEKIIVRIASSFISPDQAMLNLTREAGTKILKQLKKRGKTPGINCSDALMFEEELLISNGHFIHVFTGCCYFPASFSK